jgi:hypothetical protein
VTTYLVNADTFKLVTGTIPWDASTTSGIVELELANGSKALLTLADIRTQPFGYDRRLFRAPYGTVWRQQGDARRLVENVTVNAYVLGGVLFTADVTTTTADTTSVTADSADTSITSAASPASTLAGILPNVVNIESASLSYAVVGLQSYTRRAVPSGYYFEVVFVV